MSRTDIAGDATEFVDKEGGTPSTSESGSTEKFLGVDELSWQDKGWISPPESICSSISESGIDLAEENVPDCLNDLAEEMGQLSYGSGASGYQNSGPFPHTGAEEISHSMELESKYAELNVIDTSSVKSTMNEPNEFLKSVTAPGDESITLPADSLCSSNKNSDEKSGGNNELVSLSKAKIEDEDHEVPRPNVHACSRVGKGKKSSVCYQIIHSNSFLHVWLVYLNEIYVVWETAQGLP